ncbi:ABC transporter substrate-binding protein [Novosphingobium sp.]|uniref:ABC transporter substrate-binding protein n=1 Tax=Novosphingobium sp. TaxID=1874826 RepID=UPI00333F01AF
MLFASILLALPAACGRSTAGVLDISVIGADPAANPARHATSDTAADGVLAATHAGLVGFDAEGRLIPALAERWIVTDDGLGYIFRLRDGQWADGTPITAGDVAAALRRALAPAGGVGTGGGGAPNAGVGPDRIAIRSIRVMARRVIEIDLAQPQPDLLSLLAQPELAVIAGPHGQHHAGPMELSRDGAQWRARLVPPDRPGLPLVPPPNVSRPLLLQFQPAQAAVARFANGQADLVLGGTFDSLPLATRIAMARGNLQFDPVAGLFGLDVVTAHGFLADAANREAVAMAIDRAALAAAVGVGTWQSTTRVVSPGLDGDSGAVAERWTDQTLDQRRAVAAARVAAWITATARASMPGNAAAPVLVLALPTGPGSDILFERLHADLAAIGVTLTRAAPAQAADLVLVDTVARYPRARWFLERLGCAGHAQVCSAPGDASAAAALSATNAEAAAALLADAEAQITMANGFIPLGRPLRWSLVRGTVAGFAPNPWGWHALPPLATADTGG